MRVLTISRQFGAGGLTLGKMISEKTGYSFFDTEILQLVAQKANVSTEWVTSMDNEAGDKFQKIISNLVSKSLVDRILSDDRGYIDEEIYVDMLHKIITKIADEGDAVILGRGGQYILKGRKEVLRILLVADKEHRESFIETHYKLSLKKAKQLVASEDKRRLNLFKKFGKEDYDQAQLYDLVINTSKLTLTMARDLVCQLLDPVS